MISYNTFTRVTALLGVLFYIFIRKEKLDYGLGDITVEVPCDQVFERLSDLYFIEKTNSAIIRTELLLLTEDDTTTTLRFNAVEENEYLGEIYYQSELKAFSHNMTVITRADVLYGYLHSFVQWALVETTPAQCTLREKHYMFVPLAVKSYVESQSKRILGESMKNMKRTLEAGR